MVVFESILFKHTINALGGSTLVRGFFVFCIQSTKEFNFYTSFQKKQVSQIHIPMAEEDRGAGAGVHY